MSGSLPKQTPPKQTPPKQTPPKRDIQAMAAQMVGDLSDILSEREQHHGGYDGYVTAFQILLNMILHKKLKRMLSRREVSMIMLAHKMARLVNADETADVGDTYLDLAGYAALGAALEKAEGLKDA